MFGAKTSKLMQLKKAGFLVPEFVAISMEEISLSVDVLADKARNTLKSELFAVRSSALIEDTTNSSMAGQFLTMLAVTRDLLEEAIENVRADAMAKLGSLNSFSMIVQEFIEPDFSGVTFTLNPNGSRETVVEYHSGRGDVVVGGEIKPTRLSFYRSQKEIKSELPRLNLAKEEFIKIEKIFGAPQDIEWCVKDGEWYWLQSRPITSLSSEQIIQVNRLEEILPIDAFYYAKTEVCDVAPRPSAETFKLLEKLYADDGPVDQVYKKFGVTYRDTKFLKVILGELFVDCERELRSLFPSHSYLFNNNYQVQPVRLKGFLTSLRNTRRFNKITGNIDDLSRQLQSLLSKDLPSIDQSSAEKEFLQDYETIFLINLLAQKSLTRLAAALPKDIGLVEALKYFPPELPPVWSAPTDIIGNTFEFSDDSVFSPLTVFTPIVEFSVFSENVKSVNSQLFETQNYLRLREYGRWLALRHITRIKKMVTRGQAGIREFEALPVVLTDKFLPISNVKPMGVSAGRATGKLVTEPEAGGILVVSSLTPDIANHASILSGVIADHGGLLSHFAIIARELGLPVVVNYPINELLIGKIATIDGTTGEVFLGSGLDL